MEFNDRESVLEYAGRRRTVCEEIKSMIVEQLGLEMEPAFITDDQPLFGRGLELDSIDALELSVGIYEKYGITIADGNVEIFSSVNSIADYVLDEMEKKPSEPDETDNEDEI